MDTNTEETTKSEENNGAKLSHEARELIRQYIVSLLVLPASVIALVSFLLGFFVNEAARGSAYNDAYKDAQIMIHEITNNATASSARAEMALQKSTDIGIKAEKEFQKALKQTDALIMVLDKKRTETESLLKEVKELSSSTKVVKMTQQSKDLTSDLLDSDDFKNMMSKQIGDKVNEIDPLISDLQKQADKATTELEGIKKYIQIDNETNVATINGSLNATGKITANTIAAEESSVSRSLRVGGGTGLFFIESPNRVSMSIGYGGLTSKDEHKPYARTVLYYEMYNNNGDINIKKEGF